MNRIVKPVHAVSGQLRVPADKSIAHRAAILAAIATGTSRLKGYPRGADTLSTLRCLQQLGVVIKWEDDTVVVHGQGIDGLEQSSDPLDCGNSGTTMRLMAGLLSARPFDSILVGDESLSRRPMERIAGPLRAMGASIELDDGHAPVRIAASKRIRATHHRLAIPSAQVKSAIILAALQAEEASVVVEPVPSRDHTERMLDLETGSEAGSRAIFVQPLKDLAPFEIQIPGDFSSAAFFVVAATIIPGSDLFITDVGVNSTRTGMLDVLKASGSSVEVVAQPLGLEPVGTLRIKSCELNPILIEGEVVPKLIDEIPVLAVAATQAQGRSRFADVAELRAKETDRIAAVVDGLSRLGATPQSSADSMVIDGPTDLSGGVVRSYGDHRIAMAMAIAGLVADGPTTILDAEAASVSYPDFWTDLESVSEH
jgi:3-phosphoshikimate 1-carboxyvinyltransferase